MRLKRLQLKNWKNFSSVDIEFGNRAFIVGPNASGKSNLLDSLRFLHDLSKPGGGLSKALSDRGGLKKIRSLSARKEPSVDIAVETEEISKGKTVSWFYEISLNLETRGAHKTIINRETVKKDGIVVLERPDGLDKEDPLRLSQTSLEQINANQEFREIYSFFQDIGYIHLIPQLIRQPELFFNTSVKLDDDSYGFHFMEKIINTSSGVLKSRLSKIEQALRIAVPQLTNLSDTRDTNGVPHLEVLYEHWRPNAGKQQENQFSDGTIRLIGLLWAILEGKSVILIEEPELSLHPGIVRKIPKLIHNLTKGKKKSIQILLSTHSPDLLTDSSISAEELILLKPQKEGTLVKSANDIIEVKSLLESGLGADEAVIPYVSPDNIEQLELFS